MPDTTNSLEAIKLISDWAKWLVTIETAAIAVVGAFFTSDRRNLPRLAKMLGTSSVASFAISIVAAAMLLLTLPEITQNLQADQNVWLTRDSVAGQVFGLNTQAIAVLESVFFGAGLLFMVSMILVAVWVRPADVVTSAEPS